MGAKRNDLCFSHMERRILNVEICGPLILGSRQTERNLPQVIENQGHSPKGAVFLQEGTVLLRVGTVFRMQGTVFKLKERSF